MAGDAVDDLVRTVRRPWKAAAELFDRVPSRKPEYTDMHAKRVDAANKSFRDAAAKDTARKPAPKKAAARTTKKRTSKAASKGRKSSAR